MCDASADGSVDLTIDEIFALARSRDPNVGARWWWARFLNPNASKHIGVLENGMECEPLPERGPVQHVVFRIRV